MTLWSRREASQGYCSRSQSERPVGTRGELLVQWLDLADAYGSAPHKPVEVAPTRPHTAARTKDLVLDLNYNSIGGWHKLDKGTGMTGGNP